MGSMPSFAGGGHNRFLTCVASQDMILLTPVRGAHNWKVSSQSYPRSDQIVVRGHSSLVSPLNALSGKQSGDHGNREASANAVVKHVLCLSNGHGEDSIAVRIVKELEVLGAERTENLIVEALPLVGVGAAFSQAGISLRGRTKVMPSGGFIYMDILQLLGDISAGLLHLTIDQWRTIMQWLDEKPDGFIIAVGDVFPLVLAWLASRHLRRKQKKDVLGFAFIGTAKSEFYLQTDVGSCAASSKHFHVESLLGGIYFPWERALMVDSTCRLVAPRDYLTATVLRRQLPVSAQAKEPFQW